MIFIDKYFKITKVKVFFQHRDVLSVPYRYSGLSALANSLPFWLGSGPTNFMDLDRLERVLDKAPICGRV